MEFFGSVKSCPKCGQELYSKKDNIFLGERKYIQKGIIDDHLLITCPTCGYKWNESCKDKPVTMDNVNIITKENYQKIKKMFRENEPIDIFGVKMFIKRMEIEVLHHGCAELTIYLHRGKVLIFSLYNYDESWDR